MSDIRNLHREKEFGELKENRPKVVLEIGVGSLPHYHNSSLNRALFKQGAQYIAFDISEDRLNLLSRKPFYPGDREVAVVRGDAIFLPFADDSVDVIVLPDILNSVIVSETDVLKMPDGTKKKPSYDNASRKEAHSFGGKPEDLKKGLLKIVQEALRVLKHGGRLNIIQRLSIENALGASFRPYEDTLQFLRESQKFENWEVKKANFTLLDGPEREMQIISAIKK